MKYNYPWNRPLRMVRKLSGILALSAISALFTTNADAQYCGTATSNTAITPTTVSQNTVSYNSGIRAFNFTTVAGRSYTFATCGLTSQDTYLRLYSTGTGGTILASDDDGCSSQSTITYVETVNSTRSVVVARYSCNALTGATQMSYIYSAPGNACGAAINIPSAPVTNQALVCTGAATPGNLNASNVPATCGGATNNYKGGQEALYTYTAAATGIHTISITGQTYNAIFVYSGACPASGGVCVGSVGSSASTESLPVNMTLGTQYYIWFDTWISPNSPCPGNFSITVPAGGGSGCTSSTSYQGGAVAAPGGSVTLTTCAYGGEYSPATGLVAANTYTITGSGGTGNYLTIRTSADVLLQAGLSPQVLTGYTGAIRVIVHVNAACATDATCHTLSVATGGGGPVGGCLTADNGQYPAGAVTPTCSGVPADVALGCGYASEYSVLNLTNGVNYIFTSSIATDYITISNAAGTTALVFGTGPVNYTPTTTTTYRFYTHTNSACGAQSSCRLRYVQCGTPLPPPANNDCANAVALTVGASGSCPASATSGTTVGATGGATPAATCLIPGLVDVWYSFNSGANTSVQFNIVLGTMTVRAIQVLTACGGTETYCLGDQSSGAFPVTASTNYRLRILTTTGGAGTFSICLQSPPPPPANDACANAIVVNSYPYTSAVINNTDATDDIPASSCDGPYKNVWWKVSGVCGTMSAKTCTGNTNFDTEMAVFSGSCGTFTAITCNDDGGPASCTANQSSVSWTATQGTDYYISVGSYYSNYITGNLQLNVTVVDGDGDGTGDVCDLCPSDPNKIAPGACGCGVVDVPATYYADTDGDGFGDASASLAGFTCVVPAGYVTDNSDCDDTQNLYADNDGDGFGAGAPVACGVANNSDCNDAQLQYLDADSDGFGAGAPVACGVADNTDCDDTQLLYADTDGDGYGAGAPVACGVADNTDSCPTTFGIVGSACDAGPGFVLGQLNASCNCVGVQCTTDLTLDITMPAFGTLPTWELREDATNILVQNGGGGFANPGINQQFTCLPDGKFRLIVSGVPAGGSYMLRTSGNPGTRIIDNSTTVAGTTSVTPYNTTPAALSSHGAVQIPVGTNDLLFTSCDKEFWVSGEYLVCNEDAAVAADYNGGGAAGADSGYDFWFYNPNGGYSYIRQRRHNVSDNFANIGSARTCHMKVNNWATANHIPNGVKLNVRVRAVVNNVPANWGPACRFVRDEALAACPPTKLFDVPGNPQFYSCGVTRQFVNNTANRIYARPVSGANKYKFTFSSGEGTFSRVSNYYYMNLGWTGQPSMAASGTYEVTVQASLNNGATYCVVGDVCLVTIVPTAIGGSQNAALDNNGAASLNIWPNPNNGDVLNMSLHISDPFISTVSMDIFDLSGKRMIARTVAIQDGVLNTTIDLNGDLAVGMYMVKVTAGDEVFTQRVVIQK